MDSWIEISGAYGRDYKSAKAANADWIAGMDFRDNTTGQYLSIRDMAESMNVIIRYNGGLKVTNAKRATKANLAKADEAGIAVFDSPANHADFCNVNHEPGKTPCKRVVSAPDYVDASEMEITEAGGGELPDSTIEVTELSSGITYSEPVKLSGEFDAIGYVVKARPASEVELERLSELLAPVGFEHPPVVHECRDALFLLSHLNDTTELAGDDCKLYSYEEYEGAVIQDSYELFPTHTIDCIECEAMRIIWVQHQYLKAMEAIHIMKRGVNLILRAQMENLRLAIQYELEISRDMDGK